MEQSPVENTGNLTPASNLTPPETKSSKSISENDAKSQIIDYIAESLPEGTPLKIRNSIHAGFYLSALQSNWSVRSLSDYALERFQERISHDTFQRFRKLLPSNKFLPTTYIKDRLKDIDVSINSYQEIQCLIEIQKQRVSEDLIQEDRVKDNAELRFPSRRATTENIQILWTMLKEYKNLEIALGIVNSDSGNAERFSGVSESERTARKVVDGWTDEHKDRFLEILKDVKKLKDNTIEAQYTEPTNGDGQKPA
jgi:hypothetical protein